MKVPHKPLKYHHCKCFLDFTHALVLIAIEVSTILCQWHVSVAYNVYVSVCMCILCVYLCISVWILSVCTCMCVGAGVLFLDQGHVGLGTAI